jgi:hypothetical protein
MDCYATERHVNWSVREGVYEFRFEKHGHKYRWRCTEAFRAECLHAVTLDAHNRDLNLSLVDAVFVQDKIRTVIQSDREWLIVEAAPVESVAHASEYDKDRWWLLSVLGASILFWGWVFTLVIRRVWQ